MRLHIRCSDSVQYQNRNVWRLFLFGANQTHAIVLWNWLNVRFKYFCYGKLKKSCFAIDFHNLYGAYDCSNKILSFIYFRIYFLHLKRTFNWTKCISFILLVDVYFICMFYREMSQNRGQNTNFIKSYLHFVLIVILVLFHSRMYFVLG